ncbi:MAG: Apolipoprotein N-acyltransferase [Chlamydiia bacterium]|nr:Apolipoprotein N-acyltransferase [Chlamydiia bacterium]MCH9618436.1 Apolipoprotein N-acyltransferase [Chlamydiia bacterium]MCH9623762.1 Apolipoprotein N-acyltransferase [Chlamydiia bacterium]
MVGYLLLSLIFPLNFYLFGYLLPATVKDLSWVKMLLLALIFTFLEYARLWFICGFPFHTSGLILASHKIPLQLASVAGLYGLTFIVIVWAQISVKCLFERSLIKYSCLGPIPMLLGTFLLYTHQSNTIPGKKINIAVIQPGFKVEEKMLFKGREKSFIPVNRQLKKIWSLLEPLAPTDLIILPEVCLAGDADLARYSKQEIEEIFSADFLPFFDGREMVSHKEVFAALSTYLNSDILVGLIQANHNSGVYFSNGKMVDVYHKRRLLPLGEYIPFAFLRKFAAKYGIYAFFEPGLDKNLLEGKVKILPTICYDEAFPDDYLSYTGPQADLLVNLTNDAWFLGSSLVKNHHYIGIVRAVENGKASIRCCNTGISSFILPTGEVISRLEEWDKNRNPFSGALYHRFKTDRVNTIFSLLGNFGLLILALLFIGALKVFSRKDEQVEVSLKSLNKK